MDYWFFSQTDPRLVQQAEANSKKDQGEFLQFENFTFINGVGEITGHNLILVLSDKEEVPEDIGYNLFDQIYDPSGNLIWKIYQVENN